MRPTTPREGGGSGGDDLPLVGRTPAMQALYKLVARVMNTELPVMITGESGTGKSLIARAIHDFSDRRNLPFVVVTPDDLGPIDGPAQVLSRAGQGTILFDEVGDLDEDAQARVTRMLDSLTDPAPRILSTSQLDMQKKIDQGDFRQDLFYRLGGVTIPVPSLRERLEDIPALADHFLTRAERDGLAPRRLSARFLVYAVTSHASGGRERQRGNSRQIGAYEIVERVVPTLDQQPAAQLGSLRFDGLRVLTPASAQRKGVAVYEMAFGLEMAFPAPRDLADLADFAIYSATHEVGEGPATESYAEIPTGNEET